MEKHDQFFESYAIPFLRDEGEMQEGVWCGLGYLGYISERLWKTIRGFWKKALFLEGDSGFGGGIGRVGTLFLWASIQHDDPSARREIFDFCAKDPRLASLAVRALVEWTLRLSGSLQEREWREWIFPEVRYLLDCEDNYSSSAHHLNRLLYSEEAERAISDDALILMSSHCEWGCGEFPLTADMLYRLLENSAVADEEKARFVIAQIGGTDIAEYLFDDCDSLFGLISFDSVKPSTKDVLRDILVLKQIEIPKVLRTDGDPEFEDAGD